MVIRKMRKNIILFIIIGVFFISLISAYSFNFWEDFSIVQKQNTCFNIPSTCDNCTYINITILLPNGTVIIDNQIMTNLSNSYYYNYTFCNTSILGKYFVITNYNEDIDLYSDFNFFEITQTGYKQTTAESMGSAIFLILMLFLTFLFLFIGFKLSDTEYLWVMGIFFLVISIFFIIYDVWLGAVYHLNYIGANNVSAIPSIIFYLVLLSLGGGLLISGILLFKKLPKVIEFFKRSILAREEDGWDGGKDF